MDFRPLHALTRGLCNDTYAEVADVFSVDVAPLTAFFFCAVGFSFTLIGVGLAAGLNAALHVYDIFTLYLDVNFTTPR